MDLVEPQYKAVVRQNLIDDIRRRGNALTAGDVGYRYVLRALEENDASEVIYDMNSRYDVPGLWVPACARCNLPDRIVAGLPRGVEQPLHAGAPDGMALQRFGRHSPESRFGGLQRDRDPSAGGRRYSFRGRVVPFAVRG